MKKIFLKIFIFSFTVLTVVMTSCGNSKENKECSCDTKGDSNTESVSEQFTNLPSNVTKVNELTNVIVIRVSPDDKVFITMKSDSEQRHFDAVMRIKMLKQMAKIYREQKGEDNAVSFTPADSIAFSELGVIGVPFNQLPAFLRLSSDERSQWISGSKEDAGKNSGIPIEMLDEKQKEIIRHSNNSAGLTEFQMWILAANEAASEWEKELTAGEKDGDSKKEIPLIVHNILTDIGFTVSTDKSAKFETTSMVMENMQTIGKNKFILLTELRE